MSSILEFELHVNFSDFLSDYFSIEPGAVYVICSETKEKAINNKNKIINFLTHNEFVPLIIEKNENSQKEYEGFFYLEKFLGNEKLDKLLYNNTTVKKIEPDFMNIENIADFDNILTNKYNFLDPIIYAHKTIQVTKRITNEVFDIVKEDNRQQLIIFLPNLKDTHIFNFIWNLLILNANEVYKTINIWIILDLSDSYCDIHRKLFINLLKDYKSKHEFIFVSENDKINKIDNIDDFENNIQHISNIDILYDNLKFDLQECNNLLKNFQFQELLKKLKNFNLINKGHGVDYLFCFLSIISYLDSNTNLLSITRILSEKKFDTIPFTTKSLLVILALRENNKELYNSLITKMEQTNNLKYNSILDLFIQELYWYNINYIDNNFVYTKQLLQLAINSTTGQKKFLYTLFLDIFEKVIFNTNIDMNDLLERWWQIYNNFEYWIPYNSLSIAISGTLYNFFRQNIPNIVKTIPKAIYDTNFYAQDILTRMRDFRLLALSYGQSGQYSKAVKLGDNALLVMKYSNNVLEKIHVLRGICDFHFYGGIVYKKWHETLKQIENIVKENHIQKFYIWIEYEKVRHLHILNMPIDFNIVFNKLNGCLQNQKETISTTNNSHIMYLQVIHTIVNIENKFILNTNFEYRKQIIKEHFENMTDLIKKIENIPEVEKIFFPYIYNIMLNKNINDNFNNLNNYFINIDGDALIVAIIAKPLLIYSNLSTEQKIIFISSIWKIFIHILFVGWDTEKERIEYLNSVTIQTLLKKPNNLNINISGMLANLSMYLNKINTLKELTLISSLVLGYLFDLTKVIVAVNTFSFNNIQCSETVSINNCKLNFIHSTCNIWENTFYQINNFSDLTFVEMKNREKITQIIEKNTFVFLYDNYNLIIFVNNNSVLKLVDNNGQIKEKIIFNEEHFNNILLFLNLFTIVENNLKISEEFHRLQIEYSKTLETKIKNFTILSKSLEEDKQKLEKINKLIEGKIGIKKQAIENKMKYEQISQLSKMAWDVGHQLSIPIQEMLQKSLEVLTLFDILKNYNTNKVIISEIENSFVNINKQLKRCQKSLTNLDTIRKTLSEEKNKRTEI